MSITEPGDLTPAVPEPSRYLLLATDANVQGAHSGYTYLANYIPRARLIKAPRAEPRRLVSRAAVRMLAGAAATRWYQLGSLSVEARAWWALQTGFKGLVHLMWAERDWGFLDQLPSRSRPVLCATFHGCPDDLPKIIRDPRRLDGLDAIILMSEVQRPFFESRGVSSSRIHVIHHGVDCEYFSPAERSPSWPFTVLSVGSYRRNFALLRRVCEMLAHHRDIHFRIVAPRSMERELQGQKNVTVISGLSDDELRDAYRESSCLLLTLDAATANNAVLEAMACGVPIVSEAVGGIGEYTGPDCANLCEPGSAHALVESILMLFREPSVFTRMSHASRQRAENLDWPLVAERTVRLYEALLGSSTVIKSAVK